LEHAAGNRNDEGRRFLQADRAQVTAGIYYIYKATHQRIIRKVIISKEGIIKPGGYLYSLIYLMMSIVVSFLLSLNNKMFYGDSL